jgi:hypothetical protein
MSDEMMISFGGKIRKVRTRKRGKKKKEKYERRRRKEET